MEDGLPRGAARHVPDGILVIDRPGYDYPSKPTHRRSVENSAGPRRREDDEAQVRHVLGMVKDPDKFDRQVSYLYSHPDESIRDEVELMDGTSPRQALVSRCGQRRDLLRENIRVHDITERRRAEELLKRIVTSSPMGIFILAAWKDATGQLRNSRVSPAMPKKKPSA